MLPSVREQIANLSDDAPYYMIWSVYGATESQRNEEGISAFLPLFKQKKALSDFIDIHFPNSIVLVLPCKPNTSLL